MSAFKDKRILILYVWNKLNCVRGLGVDMNMSVRLGSMATKLNALKIKLIFRTVPKKISVIKKVIIIINKFKPKKRKLSNNLDRILVLYLGKRRRTVERILCDIVLVLHI